MSDVKDVQDLPSVETLPDTKPVLTRTPGLQREDTIDFSNAENCRGNCKVQEMVWSMLPISEDQREELIESCCLKPSLGISGSTPE